MDRVPIAVLHGYDGPTSGGRRKKRRRKTGARTAAQKRFARVAKSCAAEFGGGKKRSFLDCVSRGLRKK